MSACEQAACPRCLVPLVDVAPETALDEHTYGRHPGVLELEGTCPACGRTVTQARWAWVDLTVDPVAAGTRTYEPISTARRTA